MSLRCSLSRRCSCWPPLMPYSSNRYSMTWSFDILLLRSSSYSRHETFSSRGRQQVQRVPSSWFLEVRSDIAQGEEDILAEVFMPWGGIFIVTDFMYHSSLDGVLKDVAKQGNNVWLLLTRFWVEPFLEKVTNATVFLIEVINVWWSYVLDNVTYWIFFGMEKEMKWLDIRAYA